MKTPREVLLRRVAALVLNTPFTLHEVADAVAVEVARRAEPKKRGGMPKGRKMNRRAPQQDRISELLARSGGASVAEIRVVIGAVKPSSVDSQLRAMERKGKAYRGKGPTGRAVRWFDRAEIAEAYSASLTVDAEARAASASAGRVPAMRDLIVALVASRPGLTRDEIAAELGLTESKMLAHSKHLTGAVAGVRRIYTAVVAGLPTRYFASPEAASECATAARLAIRPPKAPKPPREPKPPKAAKAPREPKVKAPKPKREPKPGIELVKPARAPKAEKPQQPTGEVIVPAGLVIQRCPTPMGRFEVAANAPLSGGFSTGRPGINPLTGKAWA